MIVVEIKEQIDEEEWDNLLLSSESSLFYQSSDYHKLLQKYLDVQLYYIIAYQGGKLMGGLPIMITSNNDVGNVGNSLPFYGSNGTIAIDSSLSEKETEAIHNEIIISLNKIISEKCIAYTIVSNPFEVQQQNWLRDNFEYNFTDYRIGQITLLPEMSHDIGGDLLKMYHNPRPRNIRKAVKSDVKIEFSSDLLDLKFLCKVHQDNIKAIGGISKEWRFFELINKLIPKKHYKVWIAKIDGKKVAGLLAFYFNKTVEYYTPATIHEFRNLQPSALIIHEAMINAVQEGYKNWNWGGTWVTQKGVYDFKKKWAAADMRYNYYTRVIDMSILNQSKDYFLEKYPYFYVVSYDNLNKNE